MIPNKHKSNSKKRRAQNIINYIQCYIRDMKKYISERSNADEDNKPFTDHILNMQLII